MITRWQDVLLLVLLVPAVPSWPPRSRRPMRGRRLARPRPGLARLPGHGVACQLLAWHVQYGPWLVMPQGCGYMLWTRPLAAPFLLSTYHGLLLWAPAFALGLAAAPFARIASGHGRAWLWGAGPAILFTVYTCAAVSDWYGGESYGPRRLSTLAPLAAVGLASLLAPLRPRARVLAAVAVVAWTIFTLTALFSRYDDLSVAFGGAPSRWHPTGEVSGARWIDRPGEWPRCCGRASRSPTVHGTPTGWSAWRRPWSSSSPPGPGGARCRAPRVCSSWRWRPRASGWWLPRPSWPSQ